MTPYPEEPPDDNQMHALPNATDAERDLVGAVLYDPRTFEMAGLDPSDFYIHRWKWVWKACEDIQADGYNLDLALEFDHDTFSWQSKGETSQVRTVEAEDEILTILGDLGKATVGTVSRELGKDKTNTRRYLASLWVKGKVRKEEIDNRVYYSPTLPASTEMKEVRTLPTPPTLIPSTPG